VRVPTATDIAAVLHPDLAHPFSWAETFGGLAVVVGCAIAYIGVYATYTTWRDSDRPSRREHQRLFIVTAGVFLAVGLAVAAFGVWLF
jgi:hypothetical protein